MVFLFSPFKFVINRLYEFCYLLDKTAEGVVKLSDLSRTMTVRYTENIENSLGFKFFDTLGGLDYVRMFVKIKHPYITIAKDKYTSKYFEDFFLVFMVQAPSGDLNTVKVKIKYDFDLAMDALKIRGTSSKIFKGRVYEFKMLCTVKDGRNLPMDYETRKNMDIALRGHFEKCSEAVVGF